MYQSSEEDFLTGSAWTKMLLTAGGYDAQDAGMVGTNWESGVASLADAAGLNRGLDADYDPGAVLPRDAACQLAYNSLVG